MDHRARAPRGQDPRALIFGICAALTACELDIPLRTLDGSASSQRDSAIVELQTNADQRVPDTTPRDLSANAESILDRAANGITDRALAADVGGGADHTAPDAGDRTKDALPEDAGSERDGRGGACQPSCSGKQCGSDGCGGSCGACSSGNTCNDSGQCRAAPKTGSYTKLHYAFNASADEVVPFGFNLIDVSSVAEVNRLPSAAKGLVWLGTCGGANAAFTSRVRPFIGNPKVWGFYLMDEPDPTGEWSERCPPANLRAQSDWIHANFPGAKTFIVLMVMSETSNPTYENTYNPANSQIDYYGLDPYPCRTNLNGCELSWIPKAVSAAVRSGVPLERIVPVYQGFGGGNYETDSGGKYRIPTVDELRRLIDTWKAAVPAPVFDSVYSWGQQEGDDSIAAFPALQKVFAEHNGR